MQEQNIETIRKACIAANPEIVQPVYDGANTYIDRPIHLADVLLAMDERLDTPFFPDANEWELFLFHKWNLHKDTLTDQSDETLSFLAKLLTNE